MSPPGNLMAPPMVEVCVVADPPEAKITVNGNELTNGSCTKTYEGNAVEITASAEGYEPYQESYSPPPPMDPSTPSSPHNIQLKKVVK